MMNPWLADLRVLTGDWTMLVTNAEFVSPGDSLKGRASFDWLDDGFIVFRSSFDAGPPTSTSVIGRSEHDSDYQMMYFDERGVARIYAMTLEERNWTLLRSDPDFHQRFVGQISEDGASIDGRWEKSDDLGTSWQHDFNLTYSKR